MVVQVASRVQTRVWGGNLELEYSSQGRLAVLEPA